MKHGCSWCLESSHTLANCPKAAALNVVRVHGVIDPMHDEPEMSVVDRLHRLRAFTRGLLTDMRRAGVSPSPETAALTPPLDSFEP
jgi:hypothetical protein